VIRSCPAPPSVGDSSNRAPVRDRPSQRFRRQAGIAARSARRSERRIGPPLCRLEDARPPARRTGRTPGTRGREGTHCSAGGRTRVSVQRFHDASTAPFGTCHSAPAMADIPLPKRPPEDAPGRTRTCDPLLRRREHLLRSTAACRSVRSASDRPQIAAALCCGLPLPRRFQMSAQKSQVDVMPPVKAIGRRRECWALPPGDTVAQSRSPALADIIGARRVRTAAMISSGSIPCR
jgi:hypothetical protein